MILVDARMVGTTPHGIARYVSMLAEGLARVKESRPAGLGYEPVFIVDQAVPPGDRFSGLGGFRTIPCSIPFLSPSEILGLPRLLKLSGAALYHSPSFSSVVGCPCPWLVTIHDLNHLRYGGMKEKLYYRALLKPFARKASAILTVSRFSASEIASWLGGDPTSIEVTYNAVDPAFLGRAGETATPRPYFLCVSNSKPHKNVALLVKAYQAFRGQRSAEECPDLVLSMKEHSDVPGIRSLGAISEESMRSWLKGARAVFFPSLYEGFGLPPVEAAAVGTPVVASLIPAHREALEDLSPSEVHWVEPRDFHGWVGAFHRASRDEIPRTSSASRERILMRYSALELGQSMDRIYTRVLGKAR